MLRRSSAASLALFAATVATVACSSSSGGGVSTDAGPHEASAHADAGRDAGRDARGPMDAPRDTSPGTHDGAHDAAEDAPRDATPAGDVGGPSDAGRPPSPTGPGTTSKAPLTFALHHLWLGDSLPDPAFTMPSHTQNPWATFGYNIDGLITNERSTDVCTPNAKAHATTADQVDGERGIDNSFGKSIVPVLAGAIPNFSKTISSSITDGSFTILIRTTGLTASPTQTNTGLTGDLLSGAAYGATPALSDAGSFLKTDDWPVSSASLTGSLDGGARVAFPSAYVSEGVWFNGSPAEVSLALLLQGQPLVLDIHEAVVSFKHTVDAAGQDHATGGTISGVLKTSELLAEVNIVAAQQRYCAEASLLLGFIAAASDILHDGTNLAGQPCDGVSIGLAFDADAVAEPTKVTSAPDAGPLPAGCVKDAGF